MSACDSLPAPAGHVTVVGIGLDGWHGLTEAARNALCSAAVIAGSPRQLALLPEPPKLNARRIVLPSPLLQHLDDLVREHPRLCVLASGDPMLNGIGATLARRLGPDRLNVIPAVSSVALACVRLGWPEQDVTVVSLVSRPLETILAALQPGLRLLVLCRDGGTPVLVAELLTAAGWGESELTVLEQLGGRAERVSAGQPATDLRTEGFDALCILAVTPRSGPEVRATTRVPGLPDDAYESDGQLTRRELRALALASLGPGPIQLLWDVGAGSGSIGIEWMRADPLARAIAVEARPDRAARAARNAAALGVPELQVITGSAPDALASLPTPDAVFVGGGLTTAGLVENCWQRLRPGGRLVAHAVTIESETVLHCWQQAKGGQLVKMAVSYAEPLGNFTTWRPALPVTQWQVTRP